MAKKKYYAVKKGLVPGIYTSWGECQQNINGYPGAEYKGFLTREEAEVFLSDVSENSVSDMTERIYSTADAVAYVDGSFNDATNEYAYGVVLFYNGGEEHFAEKFSDENMASMRNVAGEIEGSKRAMKFCYDMGIKSLELFYDYEGIEKWCTQAWKAKKPGTKEYREFYNVISKSVNVRFVKVKAHSGNKYNDLADSLAKAALGKDAAQVGIVVRDSGIVANGVKMADLESVLELMQEDFPDLKISKNSIPYAIQYDLTITTPTKQRLTINFYDTKAKVWISGRQEDLFNRLTIYIAELLEYDEIPRFLNTVHSLDIDKDVVENEFISLLPNSHDKLPEEIRKYLHQAVYNLHIEGDFYVANYLVEPAIRPLEGILKLALKANNIPIKRDHQTAESFFVFKDFNGKYKVQEQYRREEHSDELIRYLNKCYTYYHNNRHTLFHWDDPSEGTDTTRVLNTVAEAGAIIRDTIALIDEYYTIS